VIYSMYMATLSQVTVTLSRNVQSKLAEVNPLMSILKRQNNGPSYSNTVVGTLAVDGSAVTLGTATRGLGVDAARSGPSRCTKCNGQCTNFVLFDVAL